ncbi:MAG: DUF4169 domain-containing protein [Proteobacteria bacterium]|nr:MAG: DUF4169 domain-containing protein [Pseudomonadota bacterium]
MSEIVNLRRERKRAARQLAESQAAANRLLHGRSKAERALEAAREAKSRSQLDQHRIEAGDEQ